MKITDVIIAIRYHEYFFGDKIISYWRQRLKKNSFRKNTFLSTTKCHGGFNVSFHENNSLSRMMGISNADTRHVLPFS